MTIAVTPTRLLKILVTIVGILVFSGASTRLLFHFNKSPGVEQLCFLFNLDEEHNIPSVYSFIQLLGASSLLAIIALQASRTKDKLRIYWWLMTLLFVYVAFDELESFHERASLWLHLHFHTAGFFYFAWVAPAIILLLILGFVLLQFLRRLPSDSRKRFLLSGSVYIVGAVGGDAIAGKYISAHGSGLGWPYVVEYHIEETMEMIGIAYFIYALLLHIRNHIGSKVFFTINQ
jgi:hypothetical protein